MNTLPMAGQQQSAMTGQVLQGLSPVRAGAWGYFTGGAQGRDEGGS